ncbi:MAG: type II secretion system F family protein [Armatimonadota bacterium]
MGLYRYEAVDNSGKVVRGVMDARDEQQVAQKLTQMGYSARAVFSPSGSRVSTTGTAQGTAAAPQKGANSEDVPVSVQSKVKPHSLATFFRQLATLVKSGRPLFQSSTDLIVRDRTLRGILPLIQEQIQSGKKLSGAMAAFPHIFPVHATAAVWAGELAGKLEIALDEVAADFELESSEHRFSLIGRIIGKLSLLSLVFAIPASNLSAMLLPGLQAALDHPEYGPQQVLLNIFVTYMRTTFWKSLLLSIAVIIFWIAWGHIKRKPKVKRLIDGFVIRAPIWGKLHRYRAISRFTHVLDGLYSAGIAPGTAWDAASLTTRNSEIAERLRQGRASVPPDAGVAAMFVASEVFDTDDVGIASAGEKSGSLPDALANLSKTYDDKSASQRTVCRAWSTGLLIWFSIVLTGYIMVKMASSYFDLAFKAADMMVH